MHTHTLELVAYFILFYFIYYLCSFVLAETVYRTKLRRFKNFSYLIQNVKIIIIWFRWEKRGRLLCLSSRFSFVSSHSSLFSLARLLSFDFFPLFLFLGIAHFDEIFDFNLSFKNHWNVAWEFFSINLNDSSQRQTKKKQWKKDLVCLETINKRFSSSLVEKCVALCW